MQTSNFDYINFNAKKIATTQQVLKSRTAKIDLYKLTSKDNAFLQHLKENTSIAELMPNLPEHATKNWQDILEFTINSAMDKKIKTFLALRNRKPCAIMTIQKNDDILNLLGIAAIPTDINKKVKFAGLSLLCQLLKIAKSLNVRYVELEAVKNSHFNLIQTYKKIGFDVVEQGEKYVSMSCNAQNIKQNLNNLVKKLGYKTILFEPDSKLY